MYEVVFKPWVWYRKKNNPYTKAEIGGRETVAKNNDHKELLFDFDFEATLIYIVSGTIHALPIGNGKKKKQNSEWQTRTFLSPKDLLIISKDRRSYQQSCNGKKPY